jgi:RimJ/RimL family protein N-acetyltransferase
MKPATLRTPRLVLDQPTLDDVELITGYCQDPIFERFMVTPWPYRRENAIGFVVDYVPVAWDSDTEFTWALRLDGELIGMVGFRTGHRDIGFWLGGPHRGNGYMTEATGAVLDWVFEQGFDEVLWECFPGNSASVSVARKAGFTFTGVNASIVTRRDGSHPPSWHGAIARGDSRDTKPGWPAEPPRV